MVDPLALAVLQRVPFLHEVPSTALQEMAAGLPLEQVEAGEIIARQGQPARALPILIQGRAQAFRREGEAEPQPLGALVPGDLFGDLELVHERTFHADLVAAEACSVLVWERRALEAALKPWPRAVGALRFAADGRRLALGLRAGWLAEGETVLAASRKDFNILLQSLSVPVVLSGIGTGLAVWGAAVGAVLGWAGG
ncbi:MAG TPA: cyclic nucleotide-binding domain-containing protein, partial [Anaerolineales bacterium]|nr:cyclic nucleotide-binding domain-containing protein [Anaerolineales bacterium]